MNEHEDLLEVRESFFVKFEKSCENPAPRCVKHSKRAVCRMYENPVCLEAKRWTGGQTGVRTGANMRRRERL